MSYQCVYYFPFFSLLVLSPPTSHTTLESLSPGSSLIDRGASQVSPISTTYSPCLPTSYVSSSLAFPSHTPFFLTNSLSLPPSLVSSSFHLIPILCKLVPSQAYLNPNFPISLPLHVFSFSPKPSYFSKVLSNPLWKQAI